MNVAISIYANEHSQRDTVLVPTVRTVPYGEKTYSFFLIPSELIGLQYMQTVRTVFVLKFMEHVVASVRHFGGPVLSYYRAS